MLVQEKPLFITQAMASPMSAIVFFICIVIYLAIHTINSDLIYSAAISIQELWLVSYFGLISTAFIHKNFFHLVFNLYWLWLLSPHVEKVLGKIAWLIFVLASAWVSFAAQLLMTGKPGIGFSGVIYGFVGIMWVARPVYPEVFSIMHSRNLKLLLGWLVVCFILDGLNIFPIANGAHLGGLVFGILVAWWLRKKKLIRLLPALLFFIILFLPFYWVPLLTA